MQMYMEFRHEVLQDKIEMQEIVNLDVSFNNMNYYYVGNNKRKICIKGIAIFDIEYIPIGELEIRHIEITKRISHIENMCKPILNEKKNIENVIIDSSGSRLLGKNIIFINIAVDIKLDN